MCMAKGIHRDGFVHTESKYCSSRADGSFGGGVVGLAIPITAQAAGRSRHSPFTCPCEV